MPAKTQRNDKADPKGAKHIFRVDLADGLGKIRVLGDGTLAIPARIARAGVLEYTDPDTGAVTQEYRDPEEVFAQESLDSFKGLTITIDHPTDADGGGVTPKNWAQLSIGHVGDDVRRDGMFVAATLNVKSDRGIDGVAQDLLVECSGGYLCKRVEETGMSFDGVPYTHRQTEIRGNHVALGPKDWGRSGNQVRMYLDAREPQATQPKGATMDEAKKKRAEELLQALLALLVGEGEPEAGDDPNGEGEDPTENKKNKRNSEDEDPTENKKNNSEDEDLAEEEEQAKADAKRAAARRAAATAQRSSDTDRLVQDSIDIRDKAREMGVTEITGKSNREIMLAAIKLVHGEDLTARKDGYVRVYFDSAFNMLKHKNATPTSIPDTEIDSVFRQLAGEPAPSTSKQDGTSGERTVEQAREGLKEKQRARNKGVI